jgi:ABC-type Mn2+/Zn2+ transport system ATPase subunit
MLKIENISKYYFKKKALEQISFNVPDGSITGVIGPNGDDKTTLLKIKLDLRMPMKER